MASDETKQGRADIATVNAAAALLHKTGHEPEAAALDGASVRLDTCLRQLESFQDSADRAHKEEQEHGRPAYFATVESIAEDIVDRYPCADDDHDERCDAVHENVDGSEWVIYYAKAADVLQFSEQDPDMEEAATLNGDRGFDMLQCVAAFMAMEADVYDAIGNLDKRNEERLESLEERMAERDAIVRELADGRQVPAQSWGTPEQQARMIKRCAWAVYDRLACDVPRPRAWAVDDRLPGGAPSRFAIDDTGEVFAPDSWKLEEGDPYTDPSEIDEPIARYALAAIVHGDESAELPADVVQA